MSFFKNLINGGFSPFAWISALLGKNTQSGLSSIYNKFTGAGLTGAEHEANRFSAEEAQKQRDWQEEMSNTAYQRQVADMQKAGINPALMYGGAGASGASTPSGAGASSVSPGAGLDPISSIMDMALLGAQVENIKADTRQKNANAGNLEALTPSQVEELQSRIRKNNQDVSESEARESLAIVQTALQSKNVEWIDKFNEASIKLTESQTRLNDEHVNLSAKQREEIEQQVKNLKQEIAESFSRMAVNAANAGYLDQQTVTALEELKLLEVRRAGERVQYMINDKILQNYDTDKWFLRAQQGFGALRDLGIGVGGAMSFFSSPRPNPIGYGR